jgi:hypothetical protein
LKVDDSESYCGKFVGGESNLLLGTRVIYVRNKSLLMAAVYEVKVKDLNAKV